MPDPPPLDPAPQGTDGVTPTTRDPTPRKMPSLAGQRDGTGRGVTPPFAQTRARLGPLGAVSARGGPPALGDGRNRSGVCVRARICSRRRVGRTWAYKARWHGRGPMTDRLGLYECK
jgi:hypothetical protein